MEPGRDQPGHRHAPDGGVQASLPIANGGSLVEGGSLGQMTYGLNSGNGAPAPGLAAVLRRQRVLHRGGRRLLRHGLGRLRRRWRVVAGLRARDALQRNGGHVRIYNDHGGLICSANTNEEVDSSPAVGPILPGGAYGIATGTGTFYPGASDENTVKVYDTKCNQVWSDDLDGSTGGQPRPGRRAGQRPTGGGRGHGQDRCSGSVWALNASNGAAHLAHVRCRARSSAR